MKELTPKELKYVPHFSVNGEFDDNVRDKLCNNMHKYICRNFRG
jgi:hypothetical protein